MTSGISHADPRHLSASDQAGALRLAVAFTEYIRILRELGASAGVIESAEAAAREVARSPRPTDLAAAGP
jgi:hypothetical protein